MLHGACEPVLRSRSWLVRSQVRKAARGEAAFLVHSPSSSALGSTRVHGDTQEPDAYGSIHFLILRVGQGTKSPSTLAVHPWARSLHMTRGLTVPRLAPSAPRAMLPLRLGVGCWVREECYPMSRSCVTSHERPIMTPICPLHVWRHDRGCTDRQPPGFGLRSTTPGVPGGSGPHATGAGGPGPLQSQAGWALGSRGNASPEGKAGTPGTSAGTGPRDAVRGAGVAQIGRASCRERV